MQYLSAMQKVILPIGINILGFWHSFDKEHPYWWCLVAQILLHELRYWPFPTEKYKYSNHLLRISMQGQVQGEVSDLGTQFKGGSIKLSNQDKNNISMQYF
jgi:hypothetical protein